MSSSKGDLFHNFINESDKSKTNSCLQTVSGNSLALILDWIESGELALTWTNVIDILETDEFFDIPLVSSLCHEWLEALEKTAWSFMTSNL